MSTLKKILLVASVVTVLGLLLAVFAALAPASDPMTGAVWTTDTSGTVNRNIYESKDDVYLNGGPKTGNAAGLPEGDYYVQVTDPSGAVILGRSAPDTVHVGTDGNLPVFQLSDVVYSQASGYTAKGYDNTPNNGNEYKVWVSQDPNFDAGASKTDNFKVVEPGTQTLQKVFELTVPQVLLDLYPNLTASAWYSTTDSPSYDWHEVVLSQDSSVSPFKGEESFLDGDTIWVKWSVNDAGSGYSWESSVSGPETLNLPGPVLNFNEVPHHTKTWSLLVGPNITGASYYASWSVDGVNWNEVALTDTGSGVWLGQSSLPDNISIYYQFYGKVGSDIVWTTGTLGPELIDEDMTNYASFQAPRTIGYWQNWWNHFSLTTMNGLVAEVNSDANGFSDAFRSGDTSTAGDHGQYKLTTGGTKKTAASTDVTFYLGQAQSAKYAYQMLRAQLLGVELNAAVSQTGATTTDDTSVGLSTGATVYLTKVGGYTTDTAVNPWGAAPTQTVLEVIQTVEAAQASNWSGWSDTKKLFAKDVLEAINQYGHGGPKDVLILEP